MTLMTTLSGDRPILFDLREQSNTQFDFLNFLCFLIEEGHLMEGDWLVCDNGIVHVGSDTLDVVFDLLEASSIHLLFLPTYSPELNPCELVSDSRGHRFASILPGYCMPGKTPASIKPRT